MHSSIILLLEYKEEGDEVNARGLTIIILFA